MTGINYDAAVMRLFLPEPFIPTGCWTRMNGTSGAGVYLSQKAIGLIHACGGVPAPETAGPGGSYFYIAYSKIAHVESELGITVRTS